MLLDRVRAYPSTPINRGTPDQARRSHAGSVAWVSAPAEPVAEVHERVAPTGVPVRLYVPERHDRAGTLLFFHGGGWVVGTLDTFDATCRTLANRSGMTVVSVDYRLAPEHRYPAALDDCLGVAEWVAGGGLSPLADAGPLVVAGDSAGGNLAAAVTIRARDLRAPVIAAQVLIYPITDATMSSVSYREFGDSYYLSAADMAWYWHMYLDVLPDKLDGGFSPLHEPNLSGLPPALLLTAECDPLRDEGEAYARRLQQDGVGVVLRRAEGMVHGFIRFTAVCDSADGALSSIGDYVRSVTWTA
jgi:acetyl esterase